MISIEQIFYIDIHLWFHQRFSLNQDTVIPTLCLATRKQVLWGQVDHSVLFHSKTVNPHHALGESSSTMVYSELRMGLKRSPQMPTHQQPDPDILSVHTSIAFLQIFGYIKKSIFCCLSSSSNAPLGYNAPKWLWGSFYKGTPFCMLFWLTTEEQSSPLFTQYYELLILWCKSPEPNPSLMLLFLESLHWLQYWFVSWF